MTDLVLCEKRKRLTQACSSCHDKKTRCDGQKPCCKNCSDHNIECIYLNVVQKRGPKASHYEIIETRLHKVEQKLEKLCGVIDKYFNNNNEKSYTQDNSSISPSIPSHTFDKQITCVSSVVSDILLESYFRKFHHMYPVLHPSTFYLRLSKSEIPRSLLFSMYSVAAKYTNLINTNTPYLSSEPFSNYAFEELTKLKSFDIDYLASINILAKAEYEKGNAAQGWLYVGMAIRVGYYLKINRKDEEESSNYIDREITKRAWLLSYSLDAFSTCATGREMAVQDIKITSFPNEDGTWNLDIFNTIPKYVEILQVEPIFSLHSKLYEIIFEIGVFRNNMSEDKHTFQRYNELNSKLADWRKDLPKNFELYGTQKTTDIPGYLLYSLHTFYNALVILLNFDVEYKVNNNSDELCLAAARNISNFMNQCFVICGHQILPFYTNFSLLMSSKVFISRNKGKKWETLINEHKLFAQNIHIIKAHSIYWGMGTNYLKLLDEYYAEQNTDQSTPNLSEKIFWKEFRKFFQGKASDEKQI